ncbi:unnamed protein product [Phyllotreta striolata]|uniref:Exoribonuclease phosphorolytic domain-containing protein n=1 Tax=Phyllotreta striolata TaxID=444603 RepID=A0A9N9XS92_PHYSR|nr:unnamed protein product [Phyllotreta striolata]
METELTKSTFSCKLGILSRPDGSAILSKDNTTVIAGIYGPIEVKLQKLLIDKASVECHYRPKSGLPGIEDRMHESIIRNTCEASLVASLHPRTAVLVAIQELQNSGQLISCAVNAVCLACLHAGIDMKFMFGAVTCFSNGVEMSLNPPAQTHIKAVFVFVFDSTEKRVIASHTKGIFTKEQFEEAVELCRSGSDQVFDYYKKVLTN